MTISIIRDKTKLNTALVTLEKTAGTYRAQLHQAAVSVLVHANEYGQISPINRFWKLLTQNEQQAFRTYVRLFQFTQDELANQVATDMCFLSLISVKGSGTEWRIDTNQPKENRGVGSKFVKHAQDNLINPDGKTYRPFYERNNLADMKLFSDLSILDGLKRLVKDASGENERTISKVSIQFKNLVNETLAKATELATKAQISKEHPTATSELTPVAPVVDELSAKRSAAAKKAAATRAAKKAIAAIVPSGQLVASI